MSQLESAIYEGKVYHQRFTPTQHTFSYNIHMFFLHLDELEQLDSELKRFSVNGFNWVQCRNSDFLSAEKLPLLSELGLSEDNSTIKQRALAIMSKLAETPLQGDVFLLSHMRCLGIYFSPVNFYYLRNESGEFTHLLAEVSNTPWNERHCYLVDMKTPKDTDKQFHVSPFNPIDMTYHWQFNNPGKHLNLSIDCHQQTKHFTAGIALHRQPLNNASLNQSLKSIPNMTIKTVIGIYWHALKLFMKRTPIYDHAGGSDDSKEKANTV